MKCSISSKEPKLSLEHNWIIVHDSHYREGITIHILLAHPKAKLYDVLNRILSNAVVVKASTMHHVMTQVISLLAGASLRKSIHGEEICHIVLRVLYHICPYNFILWEHVVDDVILRHLVVNFVVLLLQVVKLQNC